MDRNTIIGIVLLVGILITFNVITQPSEEEIAQQQKEQAIQDSIAQIEAKVVEVPEEKKSITSVVPDSLLQGKDSVEKEAFALAYVLCFFICFTCFAACRGTASRLVAIPKMCRWSMPSAAKRIMGQSPRRDLRSRTG